MVMVSPVLSVMTRSEPWGALSTVAVTVILPPSVTCVSALSTISVGSWSSTTLVLVVLVVSRRS